MDNLRRIARRDDVELWSESFGPADREVVLLVAGANAPALMWPDALVFQLVAGGFCVIRYDHRDTGRSSVRPFRQSPYAVEDLAADALAVLDAHRATSAHVVGLSMGGTIGQLLALDHAERLHSLTLMLTAALDVDFSGAYAAAMRGETPTAGLPGPDPGVVRQLAAMFTPGHTEEKEIARRVGVWRALNGKLLAFDAEDFAERERRAIRHAGRLAPSVAHADAQPVPVRRGGELQGVAVRTLVVQGGQDPLNPPPHGRHIADLIPTSRLVEIYELGHALPSSILPTLANILIAHFRDHCEV